MIGDQRVGVGGNDGDWVLGTTVIGDWVLGNNGDLGVE